MDMSFDAKALARLFDMSRDAVLGIREDQLLFLNPAATALLGSSPGDNAEAYIPAHILRDPSEHFTVSLTLGGRDGVATLSRSGDITLLSFCPNPEETPVPSVLSSSLQELAQSIMTSRFAMDALMRELKNPEDESIQSRSAALCRSNFRMKRLCAHLSAADALHRGNLPFSPQPLALDTLCRELCSTLSLFCGDMDVRLEYTGPNDPCTTMADRELLETLLLNAAANSLAHFPPDRELRRLRIRLISRGHRFTIVLDDNGAGISPETLTSLNAPPDSGHIPDPLTGARLGLSIARGIARLHGGTLLLESRQGQGTKLSLSLPLVLPADTQLHSPAVPYARSGMELFLTELSPVLDKKFYTQNYLD